MTLASRALPLRPLTNSAYKNPRQCLVSSYRYASSVRNTSPPSKTKDQGGLSDEINDILNKADSIEADSPEKVFLLMFGRPDQRETADIAMMQNPNSAAQDYAHHFHVYATKHNTHITLTNQKRNPIISLSAGNLGFKKAQRGTYDAAYQLAAYVLTQAKERGVVNEMKDLEIVLRGFGAGREAVTKAVMGTEGRHIRSKIRRVTDATRLKFGGTRSPKPRRLG